MTETTSTTLTAVHAPATAEDIKLLEQLTLATERFMKDNARQYLYGVYERVGAAEALAGAGEVAVPLLQEDLDRLDEVVDCLRIGSGRSVLDSAVLAEKGRLLLRKLYVGLGRSRALHWLDSLAVYEPERALAPAPPA